MTRPLAFALTLVLASGIAAAGGGGKIQWRQGKDHDAAIAEAKAFGIPVVLYFSGDG